MAEAWGAPFDHLISKVRPHAKLGASAGLRFHSTIGSLPQTAKNPLWMPPRRSVLFSPALLRSLGGLSWHSRADERPFVSSRDLRVN